MREAEGRTADASSIFTSFGDCQAPEVRIVADMLLEREVEDGFGTTAQACISAVRYEIAFARGHGQNGGIVLEHESPVPIKVADASQLGFDSSSEVDERDIVFLERVERVHRRGQIARVAVPEGTWRAADSVHVRPGRLEQ